MRTPRGFHRLIGLMSVTSTGSSLPATRSGTKPTDDTIQVAVVTDAACSRRILVPLGVSWLETTFLYSSLVQTPRHGSSKILKAARAEPAQLVEVHRDDRRLSLGTAASSGGSEGAEEHPDTPRDHCDHRVACTRHLGDGSLNDAG